MNGYLMLVRNWVDDSAVLVALRAEADESARTAARVAWEAAHRPRLGDPKPYLVVVVMHRWPVTPPAPEPLPGRIPEWLRQGILFDLGADGPEMSVDLDLELPSSHPEYYT